MWADLCRAAGIGKPALTDIARTREIVDGHAKEVAVRHGVRTLLAFLRRRGIRVGVLSNAGQAFIAPVRTLAIDNLLDEVTFSFDIGFAEPESNAYLHACTALKVAPEVCLFVGNSVANDYAAPRSLLARSGGAASGQSAG